VDDEIPVFQDVDDMIQHFVLQSIPGIYGPGGKVGEYYDIIPVGKSAERVTLPV
jgi:hypothetical protein